MTPRLRVRSDGAGVANPDVRFFRARTHHQAADIRHDAQVAVRGAARRNALASMMMNQHRKAAGIRYVLRDRRSDHGEH